MHDIGTRELEMLKAVLDSRQLMRYRGGEHGYTETFEKNICRRLRVKHALTMNSGTNALYCALAALNVGPGDEVIVPAFTWVASAMAPLLAGAVPVLAEIDETLAIDPKDIERRITPYTRAVIPVHMNNTACDMDAIMEVARRHGLKVVEDACQALGVRYRDRHVGTIGDIGAYSFNMFKNLTCGEGGMAVTGDDRCYERILMLHDAGCYTREHAGEISEPFFPGFNFRVSEIQGAILGAQLDRLDAFIAGLEERRDLVRSILAEAKSFRLSPVNDPGSLAVSLLFDAAADARAFAEANGIALCIDSGRHLYSNWEPVMNKAFFDDRLNPHRFASRQIDYSPDMCPVTKEILGRSCYINFSYDMPLDELAALCRKLVRS